MSRRQLFNRAKELGLNVQWATSTTSTLNDLIDAEVHSRLNLGSDASFEEQFEFFLRGAASANIGISKYVVPYDYRSLQLNHRFSKRLSAGVAMYHMTVTTYLGDLTEPDQLAKIKELCLLMEGGHYCQSHPTSAIATVTKLREAKRMFLKSKLAGAFRDTARAFLASYFASWELALSDEAVDLL